MAPSRKTSLLKVFLKSFPSELFLPESSESIFKSSVIYLIISFSFSMYFHSFQNTF